MRRPRTLIAAALALVVVLTLVVVVAAGGGGDDGETTTSPTPTEAPSAPPSPGGLPPGIAECLAGQGVKIDSPADLHSAPPQILQACFEALHGGGAGP